jgi:chitin disaccharide deacetylase
MLTRSRRQSADKLLLLNADDFGFTRDVNAGVVHCHQAGILTSTTLMANGAAFDDAVRLSRENPTLDIGCHLVLVQGRSLVTGAPLPEKPQHLVSALLAGRIQPYTELRAQVEKLIDAGIRPSHFDTHKHTHILPPVFSAVVRLAREFKVPFVRLPFDAGWWPLRPLDNWYRYTLKRAGLRATDHFLGFRLTDRLTEHTFAAALERLPAGSTEFMCHPGYLGQELQHAPTRLKETRVRELEAITSSKISALLKRESVTLINYRNLASSGAGQKPPAGPAPGRHL